MDWFLGTGTEQLGAVGGLGMSYQLVRMYGISGGGREYQGHIVSKVKEI
jgi:hypothetical protein